MKPTEPVSRYEISVEPDRLRITEQPRGIRFDEQFWLLAIAGGSIGFICLFLAVIIFIGIWRGTEETGALFGVLVLLVYPTFTVLGILDLFYRSKRLEIDVETFLFENRLFWFRWTQTAKREDLTKSRRKKDGRLPFKEFEFFGGTNTDALFKITCRREDFPNKNSFSKRSETFCCPKPT